MSKIGFCFSLDSGLPKQNYFKIVKPDDFQFVLDTAYLEEFHDDLRFIEVTE